VFANCLCKNPLQLYDERVTANETPAASAAGDSTDVDLHGAALQALSHPVRVRIVTMLRRDGPSTSSRLATELGLNSGATSYHLRQLAAAGLIEEADDLGNKRDRWWRAAFRALYFRPEVFADDPEAATSYLNATAIGYSERMVAFADAWPRMDAAWSAAGTMSDFPLRLTAAESGRLIDEISAVVSRYRKDGEEAPDDAAQVVLQLQVMPQNPPPVAG